jgi:hypothetical protein
MVVFPLVKNSIGKTVIHGTQVPARCRPALACNASAICRKYNAARLFAVLRPRPTGHLGTRASRRAGPGAPGEGAGSNTSNSSGVRSTSRVIVFWRSAIILAVHVPCTVILHVQPKYNSMVSYELRSGTAAVRRVGQTQRSWHTRTRPARRSVPHAPPQNEASTSKCAISASSSAHV